jgi:hypothetical protein
MPLWPIQRLVRKVQNRRPVVFAPSRLARLERTVRRLECGNTKSGLPDGLVPSEAKAHWLAKEPDSPDGASPSGLLLLLACSSCEPLAPMGQAHRGPICFAPRPLARLEHKVYWLAANSIHVVGTSRPDVVTRLPKPHHTEFPTRLIHITKRNCFR